MGLGFRVWHLGPGVYAEICYTADTPWDPGQVATMQCERSVRVATSMQLPMLDRSKDTCLLGHKHPIGSDPKI